MRRKSGEVRKKNFSFLEMELFFWTSQNSKMGLFFAEGESILNGSDIPLAFSLLPFFTKLNNFLKSVPN